MISILLIGCFLIGNFYEYLSILQRRQYSILYINQYFSNTFQDKNSVVLGAWAPSLTWDSKVISKPVWNHYINDTNILEQHPRVIISEPDEAESNQAYSSHGINLAAHADSIRSFTIGKWNVNVFWMKGEPGTKSQEPGL